MIDYLNVRTQDETDCKVTIQSASGTVVYDKDVHISIDSPLAIDMTAAAPGQYSVKLVMGGQEYKSSFMKL